MKFSVPNKTIFSSKSINYTEINNLKSKNKKLIFHGVPYDNYGTFPGCRYGPELLREFSCQYPLKENTKILYLHENKTKQLGCDIYDLGDLYVDFIDDIHVNIEQYYSTLKGNFIPVMLGGDHSFTYSAVKGLYKNFDDIVYIHIDQHLDIELNVFSDEKSNNTTLCHSNFVSYLKKDLNSLKIYQYGLWPFYSAEVKCATELTLLFEEISEKYSSEFLSLNDIEQNSPIFPKGKNIYLSLDVDVICSNFIKNTGFPSVLGLDLNKLTKVLSILISNNNLIGFDLMEYGNHLVSSHSRETHIIVYLLLKILFLVENYA